MGHFHSHPHTERPRRRRFLQKTALLLPSALAAAGTGAPARPDPRAGAPAAPQRAERRPRAFDAHLHCPPRSGEAWQWHPVTRTFEDFVAYLDQTGVGRGIINSQRCQVNGVPAEFIAGNREVARYAEQYRGRFLGACVVNPLFIDEALREMETARKELGFVWVGELCNYMKPSYKYTIREFELLVEQAVRLGMILDVHTELEEMEYIIQKFPKATLVFPHFGDDREHAHIFRRIDLVARNPNCYIDTSGYGHDRVGMLEYAVKQVGAERVLFGSDFSINCPATVLARIEHAFISDEQKSAILAGNLQRLLKKVGAPGL